MPVAYIGLGTNLGEKENNLNEAIRQLTLLAGNVVQRSSIYSSEPWGFKSKNIFLNAVVMFETELSPLKLLSVTQKIEKMLGRNGKFTSAYVDRIIDIDILMYDQLILNHPKLQIPHPHITERDFVICPLSEIAPKLVHPVSGKFISEYLKSE